MRYYRLWIYACNGVLLLSVIVFVAVGGCVLGDTRMRFVPLPLYHPTLVYGYAALLLQAGIVQAVGCFSAIRLNERWLNVYWLLLLALLVGDVLVGVAWVFLFSSLTSGLPTHLRLRLQNEYGSVPPASAQWDVLQRSYACCGAQGPHDFNTTQWYVDVWSNGLDYNDTRWSPTSPSSTKLNSASASSMEVAYRLARDKQGVPRFPVPPSCCKMTQNSSVSCFVRGCTDPILQWLQRSADQLFVLGYCVIAFLKLCFLGILRYEIREMIQKIRLLQGELQGLPDLATIGLPSPNHLGGKAQNGNNNELEMKEMPMTNDMQQR